MKKTPLYILSVAVIVVMALSVIMPSISIIRNSISAFSAGFEAGYEGGDNPVDNTTPVDIVFQPSLQQVLSSNDTICFDSGEKYAFVMDKATVFVPDSKTSEWTMWVSVLCHLASFVILFILIWYFIRFISNIAKERIFIEANARYLRNFSFCLIAIALLEITVGILGSCELAGLRLSFDGYRLSAAWSFPWTNLLIGLVCLLIAMAWQRGVSIKNESDLTI